MVFDIEILNVLFIFGFLQVLQECQ
jgi:hypothetical protein